MTQPVLEPQVSSPGRWICVASAGELTTGSKLVRDIDGISVLLCNLGSEIGAIHNRCTHLGARLEAGRLMGGRIICPFHGACFDAKTGTAISGPAVFPVQVFPVRVEGGKIYVDIAARRSQP